MDAKLLEVAKQTLGISLISPDVVPPGYLEELKSFLSYWKDDILFRLYPHQGYGYGLIKCLEKGCENVTIMLRSSNEEGLKEGIGSLAEYLVHVTEHPTHRAARHARVIKTEPNGQTSHGARTTYSSIPACKHLASLAGSVDMSGTLYSGTIKSNPSDISSSSSASMVSTKRSYSDSDTEITVPSSSPQHSPLSFKKPKLEARPAQPLATINRNAMILGSTSTGTLTPQVARTLLEQTNKSLETVRTLLAHYRKKSRKSAHEKRVIKLEVQQRQYLVTKAQCDLALYPMINNGTNSINGVPRNILPYTPGALPMVAGGIPNYGDTVDYDTDDGIHAVKQKNRFVMRGPIANPGDFDAFLLEAGNSFDGNESVDNALAKLGLKKLSDHLPTMSIALMPHQVIGVVWMLEHERGSHKGGILADEMGLGKTVQMISTMVQNRSDDPAVTSTLICAPVALLDQWKLEIETKTSPSLSCLIYHGYNKPKLPKDLQKFDVVITTYQTLALEWPHEQNAINKKKKQKKGQESDDFIESDSEEKEKVQKKGLLLRMKWFRVVLDEAQNIRNRNTRISNAVTVVDTTYRWCLTGTPVTNSLTDCYAFMRFLKIRPWYDWDDFNQHISRLERRRPDLASSRLQVILNSCLIRRRKDSVLDGKKLTELPLKDVVLRTLTFSRDERDIYNLIEKQTQAIINKYLRAGTVLKNYSHVFVLLLRLRQLCSHPSLIQEGGNALLPDEDITVKHEVQTELERATILAGEQFVTAMKAKFRATVFERMAAEKASAEAVIEDECPICFDTLTNPVVTRCCHVFCGECIDSVLNQLPVEGSNERRYALSERPCPTCRGPITKEMLFQQKAFEPIDEDLLEKHPGSPNNVDDEDDDDGQPIAADVMPVTTRKPKKQGKAKPKTHFSRRMAECDEYYDDSDDSLSDFIVESDEEEEEKDARREMKKKLPKNKRIVLDSDEDDEIELIPPKVVRKKGKTVQRFLPSTKMKEMMVLLKEWAEAEETKNEKTIVLSQWTSCLDLVANYLEENGFTFVRYQGDMSRLARDDAVKKFLSLGKARVMLMSLKCGGVGLNLTRANRVISLDLGWSPAVENQAFDRVHRLGQVRPVSVERLVIEDTIETRILALHERKQNLADGSLGEGTGKKLGRLTVKDLANLFGLDARGGLL